MYMLIPDLYSNHFIHNLCLSESEQKLLEIDIKKMIDTEIGWLTKVSFEDLPSHSAQTLLTGHLKLSTALFSCYGQTIPVQYDMCKHVHVHVRHLYHSKNNSLI